MSQERGAYSNVKRTQNRNNQIDTHEILKREIYQQTDQDNSYRFGLNAAIVNNQASTTNITNVSAGPQPLPVPISGSVGIEDIYLFFDSLTNAKDSSSDLSSGEIKFSIATLNNSQPIDNCIQIKLGDFYFPMVKNASASPEFYYFRRVYAQITSLPTTQSILAANTQQFHFEFDIETLGSAAVRLIPLEQSFYFRQPITGMNEFNLRFYVPSGRPDGSLKRIPIHKDKLVVQAVAGSNPARFTVLAGDSTSPIYDSAALPTTFPGVDLTLTTPVAVYFDGFSSGDTTIDSAVGTLEGHYVTKLLTDAYTFEVGALNFTTLASNVQATMVIPKNRVAVSCRFTSLKNQNTNYIAPQRD